MTQDTAKLLALCATMIDGAKHIDQYLAAETDALPRWFRNVRPKDVATVAHALKSRLTAEQAQGVEIKTAVLEAIGSASMCWIPRPSGEFDSTAASEIGERLLRHLAALQAKLEKAREALKPLAQARGKFSGDLVVFDEDILRAAEVIKEIGEPTGLVIRGGGQ